MKRLRKRDPIAAYQREKTAARRVGLDAQCACGESRPEALIANSNPLICHECKRKSERKSAYDDHHEHGKSNNESTTAIPVNDHRAELSTAQYDWPPKTLQNPDNSPVLKGAASIRGYADLSVYQMNNQLLPTAELLEALDEFLTNRLGTTWSTDFERFKSRRSHNAA